MKKRPPLPVISLMLFMLGMASLAIWSRGQPSDPAPEPTSTRPLVDEARTRYSFGHGTRSFLILGVDNLNKQSPSLVAIWLASAQSSNKEVLLTGFPIDASATMQGQTLQEIFWYHPQEGIAPSFLEAMQELGGYSSLDLTAIIDEVMFASLVDYVGGILVADARLSGQDAIAVQRLFYSDGEHLVRTQKKMLDELRFQLDGFADSLDITTLVYLSQEHAYLTVEPVELALWAAPFLPANPKNIRVEIAHHTLQPHSAYVQP